MQWAQGRRGAKVEYDLFNVHHVLNDLERAAAAGCCCSDGCTQALQQLQLSHLLVQRKGWSIGT